MKKAPCPSYESICEVLRDTRLPRRYCGFQRIAYVILYAIQDEERLINFRQRIYPLVAKQCNTSIISIESSIRTLINNYWRDVEEEFIWEVFHRRWEEKPTVSQFVEELTDYIERIKSLQNGS